MNKKIFYIIGLMVAVFLFVGCEELQEGVPKDVSYIPIDQIKVEDDVSTPQLTDIEEELVTELEEDILVESEEDPLAELDELMEEPEEEIEEVMEEELANEPEEVIEEVIEEITLDDEILEEPVGKEIVIIVQETELVNLKPVAYDPDEDKLKFTYSSPLSEEGQWQTTYGDMGEYTITITASDGELTSAKDALLLVNKKEEEPTINNKVPEEMEQNLNENTALMFKIDASDLNKDILEYVWKLDGEKVSTTDLFEFKSDYNSAGSHTVKVDVSDGTSTISLLWAVTVANVDRPPVLKVIPDITIKETEIVVLTPEASDPDGDEISYTIEDPVGDSGVWQTTYDASGVYTVKVVASDGELEDSQEVKVTVINVNRAPIIENIIQVE